MTLGATHCRHADLMRRFVPMQSHVVWYSCFGARGAQLGVAVTTTHSSKGEMVMSDYDERFERGMEILKKMGRENTMLDQKPLSEDLYRLSVGHLFGDIWARPHLSLRERQLITLAANIAMCRPHGNHSHYRSAKHIGVTHEEIMEGHSAGRCVLRLADDGARGCPIHAGSGRDRGASQGLRVITSRKSRRMRHRLRWRGMGDRRSSFDLLATKTKNSGILIIRASRSRARPQTAACDPAADRLARCSNRFAASRSSRSRR